MPRADDLTVRFDASSLAEVVKEYQLRGGNVAELMPVIAEDLVTSVLERFEFESGHEHGKWQPLSPETIKRRRASKSPKMLQDTGILMGSITGSSGDEYAEAFTNVPYAKPHVSREPRSSLPLRDFFDIDFGAVTERAAELVLAEVAG